MKITDVLTNWDSYSNESMYSNDFDELEKELRDLIDEIDEVSGIIYKLSVVMENYCSDYCAFDMYLFDDMFEHCKPSDIMSKLWIENFNIRDVYFSFDDVHGVYSGTYLDEFDELSYLDNTLIEVKSVASAIIDYINGEYFIGLEGLEGIEGDTLRDFANWLDQQQEGIHEDDNAYSAAVMAQM